MHCDNGGEFRAEFENLCKDKGIMMYRSMPYSPWMNGKIECFWKAFERVVIHRYSQTEYLLQEGFNTVPHTD
jgi:transposase InsO family protein